MNDDNNVVSLPIPGPGGVPVYLNEQPILRDQFAMAALTDSLASGSNGTSKEIAKWAYELADAMMEARQ